jgi:hypothetical protein
MVDRWSRFDTSAPTLGTNSVVMLVGFTFCSSSTQLYCTYGIPRSTMSLNELDWIGNE